MTASHRGGIEDYRGPLVNGIHLFDFPLLARIRLTICRKHGHLYRRDDDYCHTCGAPWFWKRAER